MDYKTIKTFLCTLWKFSPAISFASGKKELTADVVISLLFADLGVRPCQWDRGRRRCVSTWSGRWDPRVSCPDCDSLERLQTVWGGRGCTGESEH